MSKVSLFHSCREGDRELTRKNVRYVTLYDLQLEGETEALNIVENLSQAIMGRRKRKFSKEELRDVSRLRKMALWDKSQTMEKALKRFPKSPKIEWQVPRTIQLLFATTADSVTPQDMSNHLGQIFTDVGVELGFLEEVTGLRAPVETDHLAVAPGGYLVFPDVQPGYS
jgi:hypothetical protein